MASSAKISSDRARTTRNTSEDSTIHVNRQVSPDALPAPGPPPPGGSAAISEAAEFPTVFGAPFAFLSKRQHSTIFSHVDKNPLWNELNIWKSVVDFM